MDDSAGNYTDVVYYFFNIYYHRLIPLKVRPKETGIALIESVSLRDIPIRYP